MKWEYYIGEPLGGQHTKDLLNEMGEEGWELVQVTKDQAIFKRPKEEKTPCIDQHCRGACGKEFKAIMPHGPVTPHQDQPKEENDAEADFVAEMLIRNLGVTDDQIRKALEKLKAESDQNIVPAKEQPKECLCSDDFVGSKRGCPKHDAPRSERRGINSNYN